MEKIQNITQSVQEELEAFNKLYSEALRHSTHNFRFMLDFVSKKNGKRIRPLILILSAKLCGKCMPETLQYAVILELLHTATLVHDDVVDNTMERRGQPSVMAQFDNRKAVLLGDYLLSQAIMRGVNTGNLLILRILSDLAQNLVEGELVQLVSSSKIMLNEEVYFEVIWKKTASLFASCSELGALSANADKEQRKILWAIGKNLGICFQIRDDIFDYFEQGDIGKPTGNDIREGKITLPLIYALRISPPERSEAMMRLIREQNFSPTTIKCLIDFAKEYKGIEYAQAKMQKIKGETIQLLNFFPDSEAKNALADMIDYVIEREK
ncbi:MAG: polyprenyl synthetase family protein [Candidatus Azobacteroides sp.]|nr:polyprenyl synthetase family protein [Candidatus Azobacteroides sp.]